MTILGEIRYTLSRLQTHPLAAAHVGAFQALRDEWTPVHAKEIALQEAISDAQARVDAADADLDDFASRLSKAVLTITRDDRNHALYVHFFGKKSLSEFRRPILGGQLEAMRAWLPSLKTSPHPSLLDMALELDAKIVAADKASQAREEAKQQNRQFRDVGERQQFVDKVNGTRKATHGALAKLQHDTPGLPADFADQFFRAESDEEGEEETTATVKARIGALEQEIGERKQRLAELEAAAAKAAQEAMEKQADEAALAELERQAAEAAAKAAALKAKLGKK